MYCWFYHDMFLCFIFLFVHKISTGRIARTNNQNRLFSNNESCLVGDFGMLFFVILNGYPNNWEKITIVDSKNFHRVLYITVLWGRYSFKNMPDVVLCIHQSYKYNYYYLGQRTCSISTFVSLNHTPKSNDCKFPY